MDTGPMADNRRMNLFKTLRGAWKRHDEKLAEDAYRDRDGIARLEAYDSELETAEIRGNALGAPGHGGMAAAIREEDELEHEHPPGEPA
jgi:hypothetical protein